MLGLGMHVQHRIGVHYLGVQAIDRSTLVTSRDKPQLHVPLGKTLGVSQKPPRSSTIGGLSRSSKQITVMSKHYGTVRAEVSRSVGVRRFFDGKIPHKPAHLLTRMHFISLTPNALPPDVGNIHVRSELSMGKRSVDRGTSKRNFFTA